MPTPQNLNERIGVWITARVGTMTCAWLFTALSLVSLPAALHTGDPIVIVSWVAQTFLQLVLLPIIMVGQNVQEKHRQEVRESHKRIHEAHADLKKAQGELYAQNRGTHALLEGLIASSSPSEKS